MVGVGQFLYELLILVHVLQIIDSAEWNSSSFGSFTIGMITKDAHIELGSGLIRQLYCTGKTSVFGWIVSLETDLQVNGLNKFSRVLLGQDITDGFTEIVATNLGLRDMHFVNCMRNTHVQVIIIMMMHKHKNNNINDTKVFNLNYKPFLLLIFDVVCCMCCSQTEKELNKNIDKKPHFMPFPSGSGSRYLPRNRKSLDGSFIVSIVSSHQVSNLFGNGCL